jgi:hypothetical protein
VGIGCSTPMSPSSCFLIQYLLQTPNSSLLFMLRPQVGHKNKPIN